MAQVVQEALDKPRNIHFKGVTDLVTDTDRASEEAILEVRCSLILILSCSAVNGKQLHGVATRCQLTHQTARHAMPCFVQCTVCLFLYDVT